MGLDIDLGLDGVIGIGDTSNDNVDYINAPDCLDILEINENGGQIIENADGTVSVFMPNLVGDKSFGYYELAPVQLNEFCCKRLKPNYTYDIETQKCLWVVKEPCSIQNTFKIVLNPVGNDGSIFELGETDNCFVNIEFDYLFKIKCETLASFLNPSNTQNTQSVLIQSQITQKQSEIDTQIVLCETIDNQITLLDTQIENTPYSVFCTLSTDVNIGDKTNKSITPTTQKTFSKSAFSNLSLTTSISDEGFTPPKIPTNTTDLNTKTYCITEPAGLNAWSNILGNRYSSFINGDPNSFNCSDVIKLLNQGESTNTNLIYECNVPFNTKYDLIKQRDLLIKNKEQCQNTLDTLIGELTELQNELAENTEVSCTNPIDMFEGLDVSMTLEYIDSNNQLQTAYEDTTLFPQIGSGLLYSYLLLNPNSGFYVCGGQSCTPFNLKLIQSPTGFKPTNDTSCDLVLNNIVQALYAQSGLSGATNGFNTFKESLSNTAFVSRSLAFSTTINDPAIISLISNKKIKIGLKINHTCGDVCILLDNIKLNKVCQTIENTQLFVTECPGFELEKIVDNKKSWLNNTSRVNRNFKISNVNGLNTIRQTNYDVNDERLVINTKEIDLNIDIASAINTDVWCYTLDNPCILTGITTCNSCYTSCAPVTIDGIVTSSCAPVSFDASFEPIPFDETDNGSLPPLCCGDNKIDFNSLVSTPFSSTTSVEDFVKVLMTELIDVKNRKTISSYPTIRALYDRYLNSLNYCNTKSSAFNYISIEKFSSLIDSYWFDLVEQVVPATTIWGSVKVLKNSMFDQQKFKYRAYSSLICDNPYTTILPNVLSPINKPNGDCKTNIEVIQTTLNLTGETIETDTKNVCNKICVVQMNHGSEFIGTVTIIGAENNNGESINDFIDCAKNQSLINNCDLDANMIVNGSNVSVTLVNAVTPVKYNWSNGSTDSTTTFNTAGIHSVTITDYACCKITKIFEVL
jgi:hypothetical protein